MQPNTPHLGPSKIVLTGLGVVLAIALVGGIFYAKHNTASAPAATITPVAQATATPTASASSDQSVTVDETDLNASLSKVDADLSKADSSMSSADSAPADSDTTP